MLGFSTTLLTGQQVLAAGGYALSSVCILIFNKIVLSSYRFNYPVLMTLFHMLVSVFVLSAARKGNLLSYTNFDRNLALRVFPLSLMFCANIVFGMYALRNTDIPMFATLRRLTVAVTVVLEFVVLAKRPQPMVLCAVLVMIVGSLIGGWGDLHYDPLGYFYVLLNNGITALYLVWMKRTCNETKLQHDQWGVMYYNSLLAVPVLVLFALFNGEAARVVSFPYLNSVGFQLSFAVSAIMSFLMNASTFWCTKVNSALTTSVTGQVKNVATSFISIVAFGVVATPALLTGLSVGLSGSFLYGFAMWQNGDKARREKAADKEKEREKEQLEHGLISRQPDDEEEEADTDQADVEGESATHSSPPLHHHANNDSVLLSSSASSNSYSMSGSSMSAGSSTSSPSNSVYHQLLLSGGSHSGGTSGGGGVSSFSNLPHHIQSSNAVGYYSR